MSEQHQQTDPRISKGPKRKELDALKKVGGIVVAGFVLSGLATLIFFGTSIFDFGGNLFWAGVAMIAIGAGLDAGDFLSQSSMFRLGKTAGQANGDVDQKNDRETSWRGYPNLFIFLAAGIITIVVGTIVQAIFSPPTN